MEISGYKTSDTYNDTTRSISENWAYEELVLAIFSQAICDCRFIMKGQGDWNNKKMTVDDKRREISVVFKQIRRSHYLDMITSNAEGYISQAEGLINQEFNEYFGLDKEVKV